MLRILVTGGSGFVGRTLARLTGSDSEHELVPLPDSVDLRNAPALRSALEGVEAQAVIHLAAVTFVPESFAHPQDTYAVNVLGTINLLEALHAQGFKGTFLYVSSGDVYGAVPPQALPVSESRLPAPRSPYAASKLAAEAYCYQMSQNSSMRVIVARPFNHIGPGQSERFVLPAFAKQIAEIKHGRHAPEIEVGNVDVTRDFSDVRDVVRAYLRLLESGASGEVYNVCTGIERNVGEVLQQMLALSGVKATVKSLPDRIRPNEQRRHYGSNGKLCEDTGWKPTVPFEQSLRDLLDYWMSR